MNPNKFSYIHLNFIQENGKDDRLKSFKEDLEHSILTKVACIEDFQLKDGRKIEDLDYIPAGTYKFLKTTHDFCYTTHYVKTFPFYYFLIYLEPELLRLTEHTFKALFYEYHPCLSFQYRKQERESNYHRELIIAPLKRSGLFVKYNEGTSDDIQHYVSLKDQKLSFCLYGHLGEEVLVFMEKYYELKAGVFFSVNRHGNPLREHEHQHIIGTQDYFYGRNLECFDPFVIYEIHDTYQNDLYDPTDVNKVLYIDTIIAKDTNDFFWKHLTPFLTQKDEWLRKIALAKLFGEHTGNLKSLTFEKPSLKITESHLYGKGFMKRDEEPLSYTHQVFVKANLLPYMNSDIQVIPSFLTHTYFHPTLVGDNPDSFYYFTPTEIHQLKEDLLSFDKVKATTSKREELTYERHAREICYVDYLLTRKLDFDRKENLWK